MPTRPAVTRRRSRLVVWFAVLATLALLIPTGVYAKKPADRRRRSRSRS